nr:Uma2 family endonuclease [Candidatus Sigynarchaeota archaeon]
MVININDKPLIEPYVIYVQDVSFDQFLEFANEDISCELLNGVLIIHSPASYLHETIFSFLMTLLKLFVKQHDLGIVIGSRFVMKLSDKWVPEPDIMFLTREDQRRLERAYLNGPATVVFEILSKATHEDDLHKKLPKYIGEGVKEVWMIDPDKKLVEIHWKEGSTRARDAEWIASREIPTFKIQVSWLWDAEQHDILKTLDSINQG